MIVFSAVAQGANGMLFARSQKQDTTVNQIPRILTLISALIVASTTQGIAQQKLWTWKASSELAKGSFHVSTVRADGAVAMVVGLVESENQSSYRIIAIDSTGKTDFVARIPTKDGWETLSAIYDTKWQIAMIGSSVVASDGLKVRVWTRKAGKLTKKILDHKDAQMFSTSQWNGWVERIGRVRNLATPNGDYSITSFDGISLWRYP